MLDHGRHSNLGSYHAPDSICGRSCRVNRSRCKRALRTDHRQVGTVSGAENQRDRAIVTSECPGASQRGRTSQDQPQCSGNRYWVATHTQGQQAAVKAAACHNRPEQGTKTTPYRFREIKGRSSIRRIESAKGWRWASAAASWQRNERRGYGRGTGGLFLQRRPCNRRFGGNTSRLCPGRFVGRIVCGANEQTKATADGGSVHGARYRYFQGIRRARLFFIRRVRSDWDGSVRRHQISIT